MMRIVIADDHEIIRNGLAMVITAEDDMDVVAQASSYAELLDILANQTPQVLILDLNLGDQNGLGVLDNIATLYPGLPILVLSAYPEETYALRAFKSGAMGYLNKAAAASELIQAIKTIQTGEHYISRSFSDYLPYGTDLEKESSEIDKLLSKREFEVLTLIAEGRTSSQIAEILGLSPKTVSTYKTRIMEKLHVTSPTQLAKLAYEQLTPLS